MTAFISGIQQVGVGVVDASKALPFYRDLFGMEALVFDDVAEATLMARYTGNVVHRRRATLTLNMQGGGGFELWQYVHRAPKPPASNPRIGDLGITAVKINCSDVAQAHKLMSNRQDCTIGPLATDLKGDPHFMVRDPLGNAFEVTVAGELFATTRHATGGVGGVVIGVSDMERSLPLYRDVLGIVETVYDIADPAEDGQRYRRVLLRKR